MSVQWAQFPQSGRMQDWQILHDTLACFSTLILSLRPSSFVGDVLFRRVVDVAANESSWDRCYDFKNIFAEKNAKKLAFLTQNKAKLCKILIITFFLNFFAENCQKLQKIVIIASTPGIDII
jgi:hypothetical protein